MEDKVRVEQKSLEVIDQAKAVFVVSNEDLQSAGEFLKNIKGLQKEINLVFDPIVKKAHEAHKEAKAQKTKVEAPLKEAEVLVKGAITKFTIGEELKRRAEEKRLQEEAKKKKEKEILETAEEAEARGDTIASDFAMSEEVDTSNIKVESKVEKVAGVVITKIWKFEVVDKSLVPDKYMLVDEKTIGQIVRADKERTDVPGIRVYSEDNVRA